LSVFSNFVLAYGLTASQRLTEITVKASMVGDAPKTPVGLMFMKSGEDLRWRLAQCLTRACLVQYRCRHDSTLTRVRGHGTCILKNNMLTNDLLREQHATWDRSSVSLCQSNSNGSIVLEPFSATVAGPCCAGVGAIGSARKGVRGGTCDVEDSSILEILHPSENV